MLILQHLPAEPVNLNAAMKKDHLLVRRTDRTASRATRRGRDFFFWRKSAICTSNAGMVLKMIFKSSHRLLVRAYLISSCIMHVKVVRFLPLTCHKPVRPGAAWKRSNCQGRYFSAS